ncbi:mannose-6-phosphate isomerase, class I [Aquibacillus salsiterrae]|uniref:Mannose-6-phosphate isomerase n=1 Tax=Aquibacillus salsiterrae TaxID=2950439 RepID=A0A9X3WER7_9BACI|nr:mannose-6-phosphate isomerase, class I [Aquibacillus salsiterrae]MDC3418487.1 mannose-6-phosphate isomerase, class I [Aquibacillus salsiterrae]
MYKEPIFLAPVFKERIWGGKKLHEKFGYNLPSEKTGEAWAIAAHPHGASNIMNGPLKGKTLMEAWDNYGELFNKSASQPGTYPLLVKLLDANADLSVQVHPNDTYAREVEQMPYGKTECWYVLDAEENAEIILGHHANSKQQLQQYVDNSEWNQLLRKVPVKRGDFIYVPSGTMHAIGKGILIVETQQSSDITYRVYDYGRTDDTGQTRELHLDKAIEVTNVPHETVTTDKVVKTMDGLTSVRLVTEKYFTVYHWKLSGQARVTLFADFLQISVIHREGKIVTEGNAFTIKQGDHFIMPSTVDNFELIGDAELIVSHV